MEAFNKAGMQTPYDKWGDVINKNKTARFRKESPIASLVEFFSATEKRTDLD